MTSSGHMAAAGKESPQPSTAQGRWILVATILGSGMAFIDSTVVNVALPVLQQDLHATAADVQWVVESYALFLSALILVGGALGDRFGRKRMYAMGIVLFAAASACCGFSATITELIIFRSIQGIGAALLTPGSLAIISASFPAEGRGKAIGTWSGFTAITSAVGPLVGGFLIQFSWRWIFFLNLPLAAITLLLLFQHVPESRDEGAEGPPDTLGALLATVGLGALVFGLITAGADGFGQAQVILPLVIGIAALGGFILAQMRERHPMMPLFLFRSRTFRGTNLLTFFLYGALGGALYYLPFNLQKVHGYTPLQAGLSLLPFTIILSSLSRWAGGLINRYGAKLPLMIGPTAGRSWIPPVCAHRSKRQLLDAVFPRRGGIGVRDDHYCLAAYYGDAGRGKPGSLRYRLRNQQRGGTNRRPGRHRSFWHCSGSDLLRGVYAELGDAPPCAGGSGGNGGATQPVNRRADSSRRLSYDSCCPTACG